MHTFDLALNTFGHVLLALAVGMALMVLVVLAAERLIAQAIMRRAVWQAVVLGLGGLLVFELSGVGAAVSALLRSPDVANVVAPAATGSESTAVNMSEMFAVVTSAWNLDEVVPPLRNEPTRWDTPSWEISTEERLVDTEEAHARNHAKVTTPSPWSDPLERSSFEEGFGPHTPISAAEPVAPIENPRRLFALTVGFLLLLWSVGTSLFLARTAIAHGQLHWAARQWERIDDAGLKWVRDLGRQMGLKRLIRLYRSTGLSSPVAFGVVRPTVVVPGDFAERFSEPQRRVMLVHELAHLKSGDPAWLLASELLAAIMWWHPLVHVARRHLLAASEQAADEASILVPGGPDVLAGCLVSLGRRLSDSLRFRWVAAEGSGLRSGLARRVERLWRLSDGAKHSLATRVPLATRPVAALLLMIVTISGTLWIHPKASLAEGEEMMNVLRVSWRQSLAATTLAVVLAPLAPDATADGRPAPPADSPRVERGSHIDQPLRAQRTDRERRDRDVRERQERGRDRDYGAIEAREGSDRERGEMQKRLMDRREMLRRRVEELQRRKVELREEAERADNRFEEALGDTQEDREEHARLAKRIEKELIELQEKSREGEREEITDRINELTKQLEKARNLSSELARRAETLQRALKERRGAIRRGMVDIEHAFSETHKELERIEKDSARGNPERAKAIRRIQEMAQEIGELQRSDQPEKARGLEQEMRRIHQRLIAPRDRDRPAFRGRKDTGPLEAMERQLRELREAGRDDAAEKLEREIRERRPRSPMPRDERRPGSPPELRVRMDHLHAAIENLHAAGLHDQAEKIGQQIERLRRDHPAEGRLHPSHPEGPPMPGGEIIVQLRDEIGRLRGENQEIRQMVNELREGQERLMNELRERR